MPNASNETLRDYAERIIAGEYKSIAMVLVTPEDDVETFFDGSKMTAIGLFEYGKNELLFNHPPEEES